jgi:hypothetical protein
MLTLILILAQLQISHFQRLPMPQGREWISEQRVPVTYQGDFVLPKSGRWTIDYQKLYPGDYTKIPTRCMFQDLTDSKAPFYDVDESYDHITIQSKHGHRFHWSCTIAVRKEKQ